MDLGGSGLIGGGRTDGASQVPDVATGGAAYGSASKPITEDYEQGASPKWSGAPSASAFPAQLSRLRQGGFAIAGDVT